MKNGGKQNHRRSNGFTMLDLLAVILIVCFLSSVVFSAGGMLIRARESSNRVNCAANLYKIGLAISLYCNENKGNYPRTIYKPGEALTQYTGFECKDPFGKDGAPKANDITAAMFLLLRTQDITSQEFVCPSTDAQPFKPAAGKTDQDHGNFKSEASLTYSFISVYPDPDAIKTGYKANSTVGKEVAIAADMNPGQVGNCDVTTRKGPKDEKAAMADLRKANTMNHRGEGQNVLYGDGHVDFETNPFCGNKHDNIYTVSASDDGSKTTSDTISGAPKWAGDSVLLPAATVNPIRKRTPEQEEQEAIVALKALLPNMKKDLADEIKAHGQSAEAKEMRDEIETTERLLAEAEARQKK